VLVEAGVGIIEKIGIPLTFFVPASLVNQVGVESQHVAQLLLETDHALEHDRLFFVVSEGLRRLRGDRTTSGEIVVDGGATQRIEQESRLPVVRYRDRERIERHLHLVEIAAAGAAVEQSAAAA